MSKRRHKESNAQSRVLHRTLFVSVLLAMLLIQGCATTQSDSGQSQVLEDRDEAKEIAKYLNNGILNYMRMKQVFYDLNLIRSWYGDKYPFLLSSTFDNHLKPRKVIPERQIVDYCHVFPRKIKNGISYLFKNTYYTAAGKKLTDSYYFECKGDNAAFIGSLKHDDESFPEWWEEADENLLLYREWIYDPDRE